MCGISGIISLRSELSDSDYSTVKRMSDSISHRGPDQQKIQKFDKIILANNRLKIMDLDDSHHYQCHQTTTLFGFVIMEKYLIL